MDKQRMLDELLGLLEGQGVTIRSEPLGGCGGGLCAVKGTSIFFLDTQASSADAAACCAEALSKMLDLESVYMRPEVREFIEAQAGRT